MFDEISLGAELFIRSLDAGVSSIKYNHDIRTAPSSSNSKSTPPQQEQTQSNSFDGVLDGGDKGKTMEWLRQFHNELKTGEVTLSKFMEFISAASNPDKIGKIANIGQDGVEMLEIILDEMSKLIDKYPFIAHYMDTCNDVIKESKTATATCPVTVPQVTIDGDSGSHEPDEPFNWVLWIIAKYYEGDEITTEQFRKLLTITTDRNIKQKIKEFDNSSKVADALSGSIADCVNELVKKAEFMQVYVEVEEEVEKKNEKKLSEKVTFSDAVEESKKGLSEAIDSLMVKIAPTSKSPSTNPDVMI